MCADLPWHCLCASPQSKHFFQQSMPFVSVGTIPHALFSVLSLYNHFTWLNNLNVYVLIPKTTGRLCYKPENSTASFSHPVYEVSSQTCPQTVRSHCGFCHYTKKLSNLDYTLLLMSVIQIFLTMLTLFSCYHSETLRVMLYSLG